MACVQNRWNSSIPRSEEGQITQKPTPENVTLPTGTTGVVLTSSPRILLLRLKLPWLPTQLPNVPQRAIYLGKYRNRYALDKIHACCHKSGTEVLCSHWPCRKRSCWYCYWIWCLTCQCMHLDSNIGESYVTRHIRHKIHQHHTKKLCKLSSIKGGNSINDNSICIQWRFNANFM